MEKKKKKIEFIESYIRNGNDYQWNDNHGELIRCKDCRHWMKTCGDDRWNVGDCDVFDKHLVMCEGYCAWAERKEIE